MKIGKVGEYEWNGIKLGDKVLYNGREELVIAIDLSKDCGACRYIVTDRESVHSKSYNDLAILDGYGNHDSWAWASLDEIQEVVPNETNISSTGIEDAKSYEITSDDSLDYIRIGNVTIAISNEGCGYGVGEHEDASVARALAYYDLFEGDK